MRYLLAALAASMMLAPPIVAQTPDGARLSADSHERFYETLAAQVDDQPVIEGALDWLVDQMATNPDLAAIEADHPGTLKRLRDAARPIIVSHSERLTIDLRARMIALLRSELTAAEAAELADFYASPIGRRVISGASQTYRQDTVLQAAVEGRQVTAANVQQDLKNAGEAALRGLSAAEAQELYRQIAIHPVLQKMQPLMPKIAALRAEMEQQPLSAAHEAALKAAMAKVFDSLG